ncbi:MAG: hypothetical protein KIH08_10280 [Candidatus Freyarchaeota archaeon]|nr:hypothetical protein [Candidatus Jordarchaeia archaeon]MBS7280716.1 hypothetical protein [Candidatus Jordarchaeia archaeon]
MFTGRTSALFIIHFFQRIESASRPACSKWVEVHLRPTGERKLRRREEIVGMYRF